MPFTARARWVTSQPIVNLSVCLDFRRRLKYLKSTIPACRSAGTDQRIPAPAISLDGGNANAPQKPSTASAKQCQCRIGIGVNAITVPPATLPTAPPAAVWQSWAPRGQPGEQHKLQPSVLPSTVDICCGQGGVSYHPPLGKGPHVGPGGVGEADTCLRLIRGIRCKGAPGLPAWILSRGLQRGSCSRNASWILSSNFAFWPGVVGGPRVSCRRLPALIGGSHTGPVDLHPILDGVNSLAMEVD